jgi:acyl carrier protein
MNTGDAVLALVANHTKCEAADIAPATSLTSLNIDSLGMVEIVFEIEERFDIQIPEAVDISARFARFKTLQDIIQVVDELIAEKRRCEPDAL